MKLLWIWKQVDTTVTKNQWSKHSEVSVWRSTLQQKAWMAGTVVVVVIVVVVVVAAAADNDDDILKLCYLNKTEVLKTNPLTGIQKF